jgi:hypothetical protein
MNPHPIIRFKKKKDKSKYPLHLQEPKIIFEGSNLPTLGKLKQTLPPAHLFGPLKQKKKS